MRIYTVAITFPDRLFYDYVGAPWTDDHYHPHDTFSIVINGKDYKFSRATHSEDPNEYMIRVDELGFRALLRHLLGFRYKDDGTPLYAGADMTANASVWDINPAVFVGGRIRLVDVEEA